jgi:hypothetical protein
MTSHEYATHGHSSIYGGRYEETPHSSDTNSNWCLAPGHLVPGQGPRDSLQDPSNTLHHWQCLGTVSVLRAQPRAHHGHSLEGLHVCK